MRWAKKTRLILAPLGLAFVLVLVVSLAPTTPAESPAAVSDSAAPGALKSPDVSLEIVPDREGVERQKKLDVVLIVTNKSETPLAGVTVSVPSAAFAFAPSDKDKPSPRSLALPDLAAFGTAHKTITLEPVKDAEFGAHKVPVVVEYSWLTPVRASMTSAQAGTVDLKVLPAAKAPDVSLEIVPDREGVERQKKLDVVLIVTNKSETPLAGVTVSVPSAAFAFAPSDKDKPSPRSLALPDLAAFGTAHKTITLEPVKDAEFGAHKVPVVVEYSWLTPAGAKMISAQAETADLKISRVFEEEGQHLPGGTAAFLYLFLPIVPAFFAFDAVNRLRRGEDLELPKFGTEHIVPAFLLSLLLSVVFVSLPKVNPELAYSDPVLFVGFLAGSAALGAFVPGVRWAYAAVINSWWGFRRNDTPANYLHKALLSPWRLDEFVWVEGTAGSEEWKGMLLCQPDRTTKVLGARLQVTPKSADKNQRDALWATLTTNVFDQSRALINPRRLVEMVEADMLNVLVLEGIVRGGQTLGDVVATEGLSGLQNLKPDPSKMLVEPKE